MRPGTVRLIDRFFRIAPLGVAFCGLSLTVLISDVLLQRELLQVRARTEAEAKHVASQLKLGVLQSIDPLQRMSAWWLLQGRPMAPEDWETDAQLFVSAQAGLRKVVWIDPNGKRSWSVRPGAVPDLTATGPSDPELEEVINAVRRLNTNALSPAFESNDALLVYACVPVRRSGRLVGYVAGLYDFAILVRSVLENQVPDDYSITVSANGHAIHLRSEAAYGPLDSARTAQFSLPNTQWSVILFPSNPGISTIRQLVISFGVLVSILLYTCAAIARVSRRRAAELSQANDRLVFENQQRCRAEETVARLNKDLQRRLEEFQILLEVLPVGIAVAEDPECRKIWANRSLAAMLKVPIGHNISASAPEEEKPSYRMLRHGAEVAPSDLPMQVAARTKAAVANDELDIVRSDGCVLNTMSYSAPLFDEQGKVRGVINACVDMTEQRLLQQRLTRAEKYQSLALMAGGIAHDFNNLLTVIMGQASIISPGVPAHLRESVTDLQSAASRAAGLVSQLLAFTGHFCWDGQPTDLSGEVEKIKEDIQQAIPAKVAVRYELAGDLPLIHAGLPELHQVIRNLVANAAESLSQNQPGTIEIRTSRCELTNHDLDLLYPDQQLTAGLYVRLEVTDSGCGIPDEIAGRIFDPFFTTKFVGRGLGLPAVQGIVRAHGGAIRVESSLHCGTRVEVILPAYNVEAGEPLAPRTESD
jgi:signal transduction histidine kinase